MPLCGAPMRAVFPSSDTDVPNSSPSAPPRAVSSACWLQVVPDCTNTYAAPWLVRLLKFCPAAPMTAVLPLTDTEVPKLSPNAPTAGVSWACWLQVVPDCTNTYATPSAAPMRAVSPLTDTEEPKFPARATVSSAC